MTFSEYLQEQEVIKPELSESAVFGTIKEAATVHNDYRTLVLISADVFRDEFERFWWEYENELDRQNYEAEQALYEKGDNH